MKEIRNAFEEIFEVFDEMAPTIFFMESAMLLSGSIWLTLALRVLG